MNEPYIYVASSWRNAHQPQVVKMLRGAGAFDQRTNEPDFGVYDFRGDDGFSWREIDGDWEQWTTEQYVKHLYEAPEAHRGFTRDADALRRSTACVLVGPSGRSAHLELGWAIGAGKATAIYLPEDQEPELMYRMADIITADVLELMDWAREVFS